jgi:hypothetical protein
VNLLNDSLRVWAQHREFRAMGLARGDLAAIAYAEAERRIVTPAPGRAEAAALAWHDPAPARCGAMPLAQDGGAR